MEYVNNGQLNLTIYWLEIDELTGNEQIEWGFTNLCIDQTYKISSSPTQSPTFPPIIDDCNEYKTRLSDWDISLYNTNRTLFVANGIKYVNFTSIQQQSASHESDWLFAVNTDLYFPNNNTISSDPTWLNVEMNGFWYDKTKSITKTQPIMFSFYFLEFYIYVLFCTLIVSSCKYRALSDGEKVAAVHFS